MRKKGLTKGEKMLYTSAVFSVLFIFIIKIFCGAGIGHLSMSVEKLKYNIDAQNKTNESLNMKVSELTSFDKIKDVVAEMGLAYNNENILVVND